VIVSTDVNADGQRDVLSRTVAIAERKEAWNAVFADCGARGLTESAG